MSPPQKALKPPLRAFELQETLFNFCHISLFFPLTALHNGKYLVHLLVGALLSLPQWSEDAMRRGLYLMQLCAQCPAVPREAGT